MARIDAYEFGRIVIDGREETKDLIVLPGRVLTNWWRAEGHALGLPDLEEVVEELPERLVVGTGASGRMRPDPRAVQALRGRGIDVEVMPTPRAVERYRDLDPSRTALAAHLTC